MHSLSCSNAGMPLEEGPLSLYVPDFHLSFLL